MEIVGAASAATAAPQPVLVAVGRPCKGQTLLSGRRGGGRRARRLKSNLEAILLPFPCAHWAGGATQSSRPAGERPRWHPRANCFAIAAREKRHPPFQHVHKEKAGKTLLRQQKRAAGVSIRSFSAARPRLPFTWTLSSGQRKAASPTLLVLQGGRIQVPSP